VGGYDAAPVLAVRETDVRVWIAACAAEDIVTSGRGFPGATVRRRIAAPSGAYTAKTDTMIHEV